MQVSQCYEPHTLKNWYNRLTPFGHRGMFVDTVYVSCPVPAICKDQKDNKACDFYTNFHNVEPKDVRQVSILSNSRIIVRADGTDKLMWGDIAARGPHQRGDRLRPAHRVLQDRGRR